jgi:hypothetical protein
MKVVIKKYHKLIWLIPVSVLLFSCAPESCMTETQTQSYVKGVFYLDGTDTPKSPDTLTIYGIGREETLLYNKSVRQASVQLPLDAGKESCSFIFIINSVVDTVTLEYITYPHLISKECGYTYFHKLQEMNEITSFTKNRLKGITIKNPGVVIPTSENLRIFWQ